MAEERTPAITDADVRALAAKLKGLHVLLTPAEQALLHLVLRRAAGRHDAAGGAPDRAGSAWAVSFNPFVYLDAIAVDRPAPEPGPAGAPRAQAGES
jgi:hypothetical protein